MPPTHVVFYREPDGVVPVLEWLDTMPSRVVAKCRVRIERLAELGHELRRPEADLLRDGIHELRIGHSGRNYRLLYFFNGRTVAILAHGLVKERRVPAKEIDIALKRKRKFEADPKRHSHVES